MTLLGRVLTGAGGNNHGTSPSSPSSSSSPSSISKRHLSSPSLLSQPSSPSLPNNTSPTSQVLRSPSSIISSWSRFNEKQTKEENTIVKEINLAIREEDDFTLALYQKVSTNAQTDL